MIHFLPFSLGGFGLIGRAGCQLRKGGEHFGEPLGKEQRMDSSGIGPPWQEANHSRITGQPLFKLESDHDRDLVESDLD